MFSLLQPYHLLESEMDCSTSFTLPETNMAPEIDPWKRRFLLEGSFREGSFRESSFEAVNLRVPDPPKKGHPVTRFKHEVSEDLSPVPWSSLSRGSVRGVVVLRTVRFLLVGYRGVHFVLWQRFFFPKRVEKISKIFEQLPNNKPTESERWFKPWPFYPQTLEVTYPLKGSLHHPKELPGWMYFPTIWTICYVALPKNICDAIEKNWSSKNLSHTINQSGIFACI